MYKWPDNKLIAKLILLCLMMTMILATAAPVMATEVDKTQFRPILGLEARTTGTAIPGGEFYLTLVIRNFSSNPAFDAAFELKTLHDKPAGTSPMDPFLYLDAKDESMVIEKIEGNDTVTVTIPLKVKPDTLQRDDYRLQVALKSKDVFFEDSTIRSTATVSIPVTYGNLKPRIQVKNVAFEPAVPDLDQPFTAKLYLENTSQVDVRNLQVEFDGGGNFQVTELNSKKYLPVLSAGKTNVVQFTIKSKDDRRPSNQATIKLNYDYLGNETAAQVETINLPLPAPKSTSSSSAKPLVRVSSFTITETDPGKTAMLKVKIKNSGTVEARDIRLTFDGGSHLYPVNVSNVRYLADLTPGAEQEITIPLGLNTKPDVHVYPVAVAFSYYDDKGDKQPDVQETLSISGEALGVDQRSPGYAGIPRVIISKYNLSHEKILAGNNVTLRLYIENTNPQDVYNVKISLVVPTVEGNTGGTVFSPVNSSNSFYLDAIAGRQTAVHTIDLFVDPSSAAKTYTVPVKIIYEDKDGNILTEEDSINIPVTQESRLQVLGVDMPPMAFMGQPLPISAEFVNVGKVPLDNFMVSIEGDFHKENATYFLGQFQIGASDYFQGFIIPREPGILAGTLVFSYIDNNNQPARLEHPFELQVQEMSPEMMGPREDFFMPEPGMMEQRSLLGRVKSLAPYLTTGFLGLVAAVIYWRKRRQKKDEELFHE